jgi:hypothetical protein
MTRSPDNAGDEDRTSVVPAREMQIYDRLPHRVRKVIGQAAYAYALSDVLHYAREAELTEAELVELIQDTNARDVRDAERPLRALNFVSRRA